ncbi:MAG: hypothetical protein IJ333_02090 [Clostridia bacterium]|nr:hypothetical protein [Clostridia bacterium]
MGIRSKKSKWIDIILSIVIVLFCIFGIYYGYRNIHQLRLDKVPFIRPFVVGIERPMYIHADQCPYPITWDTLDEVPPGYPDGYWWFNLLNGYTQSLLKEYMKENQLYIIPKYYEMNTADDFDELMDILEFGSVEDLEKTDQS